MLKNTYPKLSRLSGCPIHILNHLLHLFHLPGIALFHSLNTFFHSLFLLLLPYSLFFNQAISIFKADLSIIRGARSGSRTVPEGLGFRAPTKTFWVARSTTQNGLTKLVSREWLRTLLDELKLKFQHLIMHNTSCKLEEIIRIKIKSKKKVLVNLYAHPLLSVKRTHQSY